MKIDVIHEFAGPNGPIPNGVDLKNPELFSLLAECDWRWHGPGMGDLFTKYEKKFKHHVPVFLNGLPIQQDKFKTKSILSIDMPRRDVLDDTIYLVPLGVYGSLDVALGMIPGTKSSISCLSQKIVDYINKYPNIFLFFNHTEEGEFNKEHVENFIREISARGIKPSQVIFGTACYNAKEVFEKYAPKFSQKIRILFHNWALRSCSQHWYNIKNEDGYRFYGDINHIESIVVPEDTDISKKRNNRFVSFNNKIRTHRLIFLSILNNLNQIDNNLISFDLLDEEHNIVSKVHGSIERYEIDDDSIMERWTTVNNIPNKVKSVDIESVKMARGHGWDRKEIYLDSYINLTTETLFFEDCHYMSEKIFKPIANLQPFINIGSPHTLTELKKLGFKTFSDFWDESYDTELNPIKRMEKIENLITYLSEISMDELHNLYYSILPICIYNQQKLFEYQDDKKIDKDFLRFCKKIYPQVAFEDGTEETRENI